MGRTEPDPPAGWKTVRNVAALSSRARQVMAHVQGDWRPVTVTRRNRTTVDVTYSLGAAYEGRTQRVSIRRVCVPRAADSDGVVRTSNPEEETGSV